MKFKLLFRSGFRVLEQLILMMGKSILILDSGPNKLNEKHRKQKNDKQKNLIRN